MESQRVKPVCIAVSTCNNLSGYTSHLFWSLLQPRRASTRTWVRSSNPWSDSWTHSATSNVLNTQSREQRCLRQVRFSISFLLINFCCLLKQPGWRGLWKAWQIWTDGQKLPSCSQRPWVTLNLWTPNFSANTWSNLLCNLPVVFSFRSHFLQTSSSPVLTTILMMKSFAKHAFGFISQKDIYFDDLSILPPPEITVGWSS